MRNPFAKANGSSNGASAHFTEAGRLAVTASSAADSCQTFVRRAEAQNGALENAAAAAADVSRSVRDSANQTESLAGSSEQLASSINEMAASIEQITKGTNDLATSITETAASTEEAAR